MIEIKAEVVVGDERFEFASWWCRDKLLRERVPYRDYSGRKEIFSCVCFGDGDNKFESVTSGGSILREGEKVVKWQGCESTNDIEAENQVIQTKP